MSLERKPTRILQFDPFEADLHTSELRRGGVRINLPQQPFHVLRLLLQRPGELVTREELRSAVWPADTFVDFDTGLNKSIKKLRDALGDSADLPRFVETLPKRGYRFIAPVTGADGTTRRMETSVGAIMSRRSWKIVATAAAVMLAAGIVGGLLWRARQARHLTDKDTIVLADFNNTTGDPVFDDTLKQGLRVQLEQSPFLYILSDQKVNEELQLMGRPKDELLTQDLAREVCQRVGSKAILSGSISGLGTHYVIGLNALNCATGDVLGSEQVEADSREHVLKVLGESATQMRKKLGESLSSIQRFDAPIEQVTTPSLEALHAYSLGMKNKSANREGASIPFFKRAIELDPNFASAYARLAISYSNLWQVTLSGESYRKAFELRDRVSERERLHVTVAYDPSLKADLEKREQAWELWAQSYPRDPLARLGLTDFYMKTGQWEKALGVGQQALELDPNYGSNYFNLASTYLALGRLDAANDVGRQAMTKSDSSAAIHLILYWIAFLRQDTEGMERQIHWNARGPEEEDLLLYAQSDTEAYRGRLANAQSLSRRAVESARRAYGNETAAAWQVFAGLRESEFGNQTQARAETEAAMKLAANWKVEAVAALALARAGDTPAAEKLLTELDKTFRLDALVQSYWLATIRAAIELNRGNATKAVELLQGAARYELAVSSPTELATMYPVYVRGYAYLLAHQGKEAAAEFQKFIDHPGVVLNFPLGALSRLGLARAYALLGDTTNARRAYQDFLTLWKDADPDLPVLRDAKSEYAKLK
jgi:DNA-binding winged helix-turn-helix (wHTH) protein/tetratricopeptide (TPR) repeat protein